MKPDAKDALVRIAAGSGGVAPDFERRAPGRGGYLHPSERCLDGFVRSKAREFRSLRMKLEKTQRRSIVDAIRARLDRKPALE